MLNEVSLFKSKCNLPQHGSIARYPRKLPSMPLLKKELQAPRYSVSPRLMAHISFLPPDDLLHHRDGVVWRGDATGEITAQHGQVIQVVARGEHVLTHD